MNLAGLAGVGSQLLGFSRHEAEGLRFQDRHDACLPTLLGQLPHLPCDVYSPLSSGCGGLR
jgi:hypothetical protein